MGLALLHSTAIREQDGTRHFMIDHYSGRGILDRIMAFAGDEQAKKKLERQEEDYPDEAAAIVSSPNKRPCL